MKISVLAAAATAVLVAACGSPSTTDPLPPAQAYVPQPTPPAAPQPSADVRDAQRRLRALGYYNGPIDGMWGPDTRAAVEAFQRNRRLPVTAELDGSTRHAMRETAAAPVTLTDPTSVRTVQNRLRQLNFYNGPADGVWGRDTQTAVERFQHARGLPVGQVSRATISAMGLDPAQFEQRNLASAGGGVPLDPAVVGGVQNRLHQLGFYSGRADGVWGARTQASLQRFQRSRGLEPTGDLNPTTASALGLDPNNLSLSAVQQR